MTSKIYVAVAGVTNGLGHAIATALASNPSVTLVLLTRISPVTPTVLHTLVEHGATVRQVDYTSVDSLIDALRGVHTVISTLFVPFDPAPVANLLNAAKLAGVKRYVPSEFCGSLSLNSMINIFSSKISHLEEVKSSGMQYTAFCGGLFMDYLAFGSQGYTGPLRMHPYVVNVKERNAEIPGTGDEEITFTTLADIGKFVSSAVSFDTWPEELGMSGETTTYNKIVRMAEEVVGEKFTVTYLSVDELERRLKNSVEKGDMMERFSAELFLAYTEGKGKIEDPYLNKATDVKPTSLLEFLKKYWSAT